MLSTLVHVGKALALPFLLSSSSSEAATSTSLRGFTHDKLQYNSLDIADQDSPKLTDCLLSAVSGDDCGTVVAGCIWCKEPVYGLCLTASAAERVRWMPFFKCDLLAEQMMKDEDEIFVDEEFEMA